jgi:hypothetical protein
MIQEKRVSEEIMMGTPPVPSSNPPTLLHTPPGLRLSVLRHPQI